MSDKLIVRVERFCVVYDAVRASEDGQYRASLDLLLDESRKLKNGTVRIFAKVDDFDGAIHFIVNEDAAIKNVRTWENWFNVTFVSLLSS